MGQTEVLQFLKDNYPKKFTSKQIAKALTSTDTSIRRCINQMKKETRKPLVFGTVRKTCRDVDTYGARRKKWEE